MNVYGLTMNVPTILTRNVPSLPRCTAGILVVALGITGLTSCGAAGPDSVLVEIRNVSPGPVTVEITAPPSGTQRHTIQAWQPGRCFARLAYDPGHVEIRVSGSNIAIERVYSMTTPDQVTSPIEVGVQILADGQVQFGGKFPPDTLPCEGGGY
ncbi:MAG: hypothetical protein M3R49_00215 [Chloroflexota bacterium]|nr:hypothetical protein [Chloroflexota bacterium]